MIGIAWTAKELIETLAKCKGISFAKVVRNAARDVARTAYASAPIADSSEPKYAYIKHADGTGHYIRLASVSASDRNRLLGMSVNKRGKLRRNSKMKSYAVRIKRGYAKSVWVQALADLGVQRGRAGAYARTRSSAEFYERDLRPEAKITQLMAYDAPYRQGTEVALIEQGFRVAASNLLKSASREVKRCFA